MHRTSTYWSEASSLRGPLPPLWAILAMRSPYELNLDFLTEDHYEDAEFEFNLTMTYKPDSDVFVPHDFWSWDGDDGGRGLNPRMVAATKNVGLEMAANKTRKVLWTIDGPCKVGHLFLLSNTLTSVFTTCSR